MKKDIILNGKNFGNKEADFGKDEILAAIKERYVDGGLNYMSIKPFGKYMEPENVREWVKYLAENKIYFAFNYATQRAPEGEDSALSAELIADMKEIAGEYYLGELFGETGSQYACKLPGYYVDLGGVAKSNNISADEMYLNDEDP